MTTNLPGKGNLSEAVPFGALRLYPLNAGEKAKVTVQPERRFDMGAGRGNAVEVEVTGGIVGLVVDTRGRPLEISTDSAQRVSDLKQWTQALAVYPKT
jgi:hypothetical protein